MEIIIHGVAFNLFKELSERIEKKIGDDVELRYIGTPKEGSIYIRELQGRTKEYFKAVNIFMEIYCR